MGEIRKEKEEEYRERKKDEGGPERKEGEIDLRDATLLHTHTHTHTHQHI